MGEERISKEQVVDILQHFIDWLYDECPVAPEEVTRLKLVNIYRQYLSGDMPTREEIIPDANLISPTEFKSTVLKIIK